MLIKFYKSLSSLFTSVPQLAAISVVLQHLENKFLLLFPNL